VLYKNRPPAVYRRERQISIDFEEQFRTLRGDLLTFYRKRLPDPQEAEDYVQRAFERLLGKTTNDKTLLYEIADGLLKDAYRAGGRSEQVSYDHLIGPDGTGLDHLPQFQYRTFDDHQFAESHDTAVRGLGVELRDAYILSELRGLTSRESGPLLGVSHVTAATRRELATSAIREEIAS